MRLLALTLSLWVSVAETDMAVEVFTDKGSTFVRAGSKAGLKVGAELTVTTDAQGAKPAGRATVLEVWDVMARVSLDAAATKAKAHYARLGAPRAGAAKGPVDAGTALSPPPLPSGPPLKGRVEKNLARLTVFNESEQKWTGCQVRISDGRYYDFPELLPRSDEGILLIKFKRDDPPLDWVNVKCEEGETRFSFKDPAADGALKGYVQLGNLGRIIVHNSGERPWNRCLLTLPHGAFYVLGSLKAQTDEGIMPGKFKRQDPPATEATVKCAEGESTFPLPK